jgi:hypothetical protein
MFTLKDELNKAFNALLDDYQKENIAGVVFKDTNMGLYPHIYPWEAFLNAFGDKEYTVICGYLEDKDTMPPIDICGLSEDGSGWVMTQDTCYYSDLQYKQWRTTDFNRNFTDKDEMIMCMFNEFEKSYYKVIESLKKYQLPKMNNPVLHQLQNTIKESAQNIKFNPSTDFINVPPQLLNDTSKKRRDDFFNNLFRRTHI